ncbi:expressed unknown protein [Seminavis robusta]|uniref:Uncharacterized protein n=1 Tax=Seminavis robusta TaxID=568900 RepID=A0A9N8EWX1_9STRA|nr:expressed unknown protein [Seminavis robusta]|eukprot:Sro2274_g321570.1 n/a (635) ;mRNA; f:8320-10224
MGKAMMMNLQQSMRLLFPVVLLFATTQAVPFIQKKLPAVASRRFWGIPRGGGGDDAGHSQYTAVGVQVVGVDDGIEMEDGLLLPFLQSSVCLLQDTGKKLLETSPSSPPQDPASLSIVWKGNAPALQSLATCCDVMVIVLVLNNRQEQSVKTCLEDTFVEALAKGIQQRAENGMVSSVLVLIASSSTTTPPKDSTMAEIKNQLVLRDLISLTPQLVDNVNLLSLEDLTESTDGLTSTWNGILSDTTATPERTTSNLMDAMNFPALLQATYQANGGGIDDETSKEPPQSSEEGEAVATTKNATAEAAKDSDASTEPAIVKIESTSVVSNDKAEEEEEAVTLPEAATEESAHQDKEEVPVPSKEETTSEVADGNPDLTAEDYEATLMQILSSAKKQIQELETHLEEQWLGFSDEVGSSSTTNSLQFAMQADHIIDSFQTAIKDQLPSSEQVMQAKAQRGLWLYILPPLQKLYNQQLQFLREQCGKEYELALEQSTAEQPQLDEEDYQAQWTEAASTITTLFREAAQLAIPTQGQPGGALRDADFDYVPALEGLLSDMMQATETQQELLGIVCDSDDDEDGSAMEGRGGKRPAKWYEKIGAKAVVFLINYAQGWLAYQGIKRAAAQRDAHLPKFPLF